MLEKDAILSKISIIKNCLRTIEKVTSFDPEKLNDIFVQDVFVLNVQRAVQACIDIANIIISKKGFRLPASYKESFYILHREGIVDESLTKKMNSMVGFRNIAVHEYENLELEILKSILTKNLKDLEGFYSLIYTNLDKLFQE